MSLAVGGGGMGGGAGAHGGLVMGHSTSAGPPGAPQAPPTVAGTGHGPPPLMVGVDMCDKQQKLSMKQVRNVAHLPICAIDLFAEAPIVAMFPPKPKDPTDFIVPRLVGKMKSGVAFKVDSTENGGSSSSSHKTLRKWLTKSRSFEALQADSLTKFDKKSCNNSNGGAATAVLIDKPYAWLGLRRLDDAPDFLKSSVETDNVITPAIAEEVAELKNPGACLWTNSTLDGSPPQGDDFDRVVAKLRLHPTKKALTILPEEATQILFHQAQHHVASKLAAAAAPLEDADEIENMPIAVALPAWACRDAVIEALYDATGGSSSTFFPRSVCALAGALLKGPDGQLNDLHARIDVVRSAMMKEFEKEFVKDKSATVKNFVFVLIGMTGASTDGLECTALEITSIRNDAHPSVPISGVKVLANVSYQSADPLSKLKQSVLELQSILDEIAPEAALPGVLVPYGCSTAEQDKIAKMFHAVIAKDNEWANTPFINTHPEAVAMGAALLAGASHGRILKHTENKKKLDLAMRTQLVAPVAVGVSFDYHGAKTTNDDDANGISSNTKNKTKNDVPIKTIFDFDRRIPAGPYIMEFKASECVVYRKDGGAELDDDAFLKAVKEVEGTKGIPMREEAALNLRVQVYEKWTRDGEWKPLGDPQWPLVRIVPGDDDNDKTSEKREACESVSLELSLAVTGMVTSALVGERESVVQALKTSRKNAFYYYLGLGMAILFFGGFFIKSWYEEYTLKRDTARLLAFYKHVLPGSIHDGDHRSAQWVAYKYRHKKKKLWASLEKKYGFKVLHAHEWGDGPQPGTASKNSGDEDETVNLDDDDDDPKDPLKGVDDDSKDEPELKDEPDL
jgi:hypothetical protein